MEMADRKDITWIVRNRLCLACGACSAACGQNSISFHETVGGHCLPKIDFKTCKACSRCLAVCPGWAFGESLRGQLKQNPAFDPFIGKAVGTFTGKAQDQTIYRNSQSGGVATGILSYLFASGKICAAIVVTMDSGNPPRPRAKIVTSTDELAASQKSKYSPVPLLSVMKHLRKADSPVAIVGLPCHIHGLLNLTDRFPELVSSVKYKIGLLCDRVMLYSAIDYLIGLAGPDPSVDNQLIFRDTTRTGYPGDVSITSATGDTWILPAKVRMAIKDLFTPARCRLCFDKMNVFADIAVGDPHGIEGVDRKSGESVFIARTETGNDVIIGALAGNFITGREISYDEILNGQNIYGKKQQWAGYVSAWRILGKTAPCYTGAVARFAASDDQATYRENLSHTLNLDNFRSREELFRHIDSKLTSTKELSMTRPGKRVLIKGTGFVNKGAELMLHAVLQRIKNESPEPRFYLCETLGDPVQVPIHKMNEVVQYNCSPGNLQETYDVILDATGFGYSDQWGPQATLIMEKATIRWKSEGAKIILLPQAFGPFENPQIRAAIKVIVGNSDLVYARDVVSYAYLTDAVGKQPHIKIAPDFTIPVKGIPPTEKSMYEHSVCIIPNYRMIDRTSKVAGDHYSAFLFKCIEYLIKSGERPFFLIHEGEQDYKLAEIITKLFDEVIPIIVVDNPLMAKGILGSCRAVISSRFHGLVNALGQGVPSLAMGWSHKYEALFSDFDFPGGMISVEADDTEIYSKLDLLRDEAKRNEIARRIQSAGARLREQVDTMWGAIHQLCGNERQSTVPDTIPAWDDATRDFRKGCDIPGRLIGKHTISSDKKSSNNIAFFTHYCDLFGANRSLLTLVEGLSSLGHRITVFCPEPGALTEYLDNTAVPYNIVTYSKFFSEKRKDSAAVSERLSSTLDPLATVVRICKERDVDLIYSNSSVLDIGLLAAKILNKPHIWHIREFGDLDYNVTPDTGPTVFSWLLKSSDGLVFVSKSLCRHYNDTYKVSGRSIYNGIYSDQELSELSSCKTVKINGHTTFVLAGLIHRAKGHDVAIQALSKVLPEYPDTQLILAGSGDLAWISALLKHYKVENNVKLAGFVKKPADIFLNADVTLMCSSHEALGRVTIESLSCGTPVIGRNSGGTPEIITDYYNGLLYDGTADDLAVKMKYLIKNKDRLREFSINGINTVADKFMSNTYVSSVNEYIRQVLDGYKENNPDNLYCSQNMNEDDKKIITSYEKIFSHTTQYKVSALVSTYNSESFLRGCLEDLTGQTLHQQGKLEIIVVDSGSTQNEEAIVRQFSAASPHIRYLRTERESLYAAWNRGVAAASGKYLTNANTDDRHRRDALEILSNQLESTPGIDLVYGDCYVSSRPNETFDENDKARRFAYPAYFAPAALLHYQFGPQPMWRRSLHDRIGMFDGSFRAAGDYDFNLRFAAHCRARHVPDALGLYLEHPGAITFRDETMQRENNRIADLYKNPVKALALYAREGVPCGTNEEKAEALVDLGIRALEYYPPWKEGTAESNTTLALRCFVAAEELVPGHLAAVNNLAVTACLTGNRSDAERLLAAGANQHGNTTLSHNLEQVRRGGDALQFIPSGLNLPSQEELYRDSIRHLTSGTPTGGRSAFHLTICMVASVGRIDPFDSTGGLETAMRHTATALAERGHRVALVGNLQRKSGTYAGVTYIPFEAWRAGDFPDFSRDADILAFASGPDLRSCDVVPAGIPRIALFHHQELGFLGADDPLTLLNYTADAVICVSGAVRDNLARDGVRERKLRVVHNGIDHRIFHPRPVQREPHRILFVGALVPDKNVEMLIRAFLAVSPEFPGAELHLCGGASLWGAPEYIDREAVARLSDRVHFHGVIPHEELAEQYSRASICVIPSKFESFSLVSLEAQACGCVPLAADVGGLSETMKPGVTGFIYAPNELDTLAGALEKLLAAPALVRQAGEEARRFVSEQFSWAETARQYEEVFSQAVRRQAKRESRQNLPAGTASKVSVVIPSYNYGRFLQEAVESVLDQTFQDFEIIIVNDGSTDDTVAVAERLIAEHPRHRIRLISQENSGQPAVPRNLGISEAEGRYILPLDPDDKLAPTFLEKAVSILDTEPMTGVAFCHLQHFGDRHDIWNCGPFRLDVLAQDNVLSYCSLYRKEVWQQVGGYPLNVKGHEDWDFWISVCERGWNGRLIPEPLFWYRKHGQSLLGSANERRRQLLAQIVLNHPDLYDEETRKQAENILFPAEQPADSRPRVLIACTHFWPSIGGVEIIAENLGANLVGRSYRVDVASLEHPDRSCNEYRGMTILSLQRSMHQNNIPAWVIQLRQLVTSGNYHACILLSNPTTDLIWSIHGAQIPDHTRVIVQPIINVDDYAGWRDNREFRTRLASLLKSVTATVVLTRSGVDADFMAEEGLPSLFLPNAVTPVPPSFEFRKKYGIPDDCFMLLHVANLYRVKNHIGLLRALERLPKDSRLVMIGYPAGEPAYIDAFLKELARHPQVLYIPGLDVDGVSSAMAAADLLLLSSDGEVSPVCILEAMSHGVPWLARPSCGTVTEQAGGIVSELDKFLEIVLLLKRDQELRRQLGEAGQRHWQACYSWETVISGWQQLIESGGMVARYEMPAELAATMERLQKNIHQALTGTSGCQKGGMSLHGEKERRRFRVIALISAHNEGDIIYHVIGDMIRQGVEVYLLDHCSTDNTVTEASRWLGKGLVHIENFPRDAGYPEANEKQYIWSQILKRKEELATQLDAEWFIHSDADEFREAPWPELTLAEAIRVVDAQGYSALDFELLNFRPVNNDFVPGSDVREALLHYQPCEDFNALQIKAWKNLRQPVRIVDNGGHDISFDGRRVYPVKFILRHYPIRSQSHGLRKVFAERKRRFNSIERKVGWHVQYDHIDSEEHNFLHDPASMPVYDGNAVRLSVLSREAMAMAAGLAEPCREAPAGQSADEPRPTPRLAGSARLREVLRPYGTGYRGWPAAMPQVAGSQPQHISPP